jgi:catechol 2,3-dioxygenase-like lactoylglutathione lyase family enzyme
MLMTCRVHTTLPVSDLGRCAVFYEDTLGIPPTTELPTGIFFECGEHTRFVLSQTAGKLSDAHTQMAFVVDDIVSEVRELKSRGAVFEEYDSPGLRTLDGIADAGLLKAAWLKDTEGNLLAIMQPLHPLDSITEAPICD